MRQVKLIHRFWSGTEMPEQYREYGRQWAELHPEWEVIDWDISSTLTYLRQDLATVIDDLYERDAGRYGVELYVQIADVLGYYLVQKYGGIYTNCDIQPLKNIEEILPDKAWASYENDVDGRVVNAIIGAPGPEDEFWNLVVDGLKDNYFANRTDEMVMSTGPGYLTRVAAQVPSLIHVFPLETFNPIHWKQIESGGDATGFTYPEASYGVHHWGHKKDGRSNTVETATPYKVH